MAKFVFLGVASIGHFNPTLPVMAELVRRGHQVTCFNTADFEPQVSAVGAAFRELPGGFSAKALADLLADANLARAIIFSRQAAMEIVPWLKDALREIGPDCVSYDPLALYGHIAAKALDLPSVSIFPFPVIEPSRHLLGWRTTLRSLVQNAPYLWSLIRTRIELSRRFGAHTFPRTRPRFQARGELTLLLTIPELQRPDAWRDDTMIYVGPSIDEKVRPAAFDFDRLDGRPLVYVSPGTLVVSRLEFFHACFEALGSLPVQVVMSIGRKIDPKSLDPAPANFILEPFVPQLEILKRAAVFVTHSGVNSVHEALWYGVPFVAVPQQIEQLMYARITQQRGASLAIEDNFFGHPIKPARLRGAVEKILADPSFRAAIGPLRASLHQTGGFRQAADELEKFIARHGQSTRA